MNKSIDVFKTEYRNYAYAHGQATSAADYKAANRNHDKLITTLTKIRACGRDGEFALLSLTEDQDDSVAGWAATHTLPFDEKRALAVLDKLSIKSGPIGFNAKMVVQQWAKGKLKLP